jgi:hypothetical protein
MKWQKENGHYHLFMDLYNYHKLKQKTMLDKKLKDFFATNPDAAEVHVALGTLFIDQAKANAYLGGVDKKHTVITFTREQVEPANEAQIQNVIVEKEVAAEVTKKADEEASALAAVDNDEVQKAMDAPHALTEADLEKMITEKEVILEQKHEALRNAKDEDKAKLRTEADAEFVGIIQLETALNNLSQKDVVNIEKNENNPSQEEHIITP